MFQQKNNLNSAWNRQATKKIGFLERLRMRREEKRMLKEFTLNKEYMEEPDMSQFELKDGKLIRKDQMQRQPPQPQYQQPYQAPIPPPPKPPMMAEDLPPFPLENQGFPQEHQGYPPQQGYPQQYMQAPPQQQPPRIVEIMITLINGQQFKVPLTELDVPAFVEEMDNAIESQKVFQLGNKRINARNILMYE